MKKTKTIIKEGDVFNFSYKPEFREEYERNSYSGRLSHCFDGQLITKKDSEGKLYFADTYWSSDNTTFTPEEAIEEGILEFKFNLEEVESITEEQKDYYEPKDVFNFSHQHNSYIQWVKLKGAKKSKTVMLETANRKLREAHAKVESATRTVEWCAKTVKEIEMTNNLDKIHI